MVAGSPPEQGARLEAGLAGHGCATGRAQAGA